MILSIGSIVLSGGTALIQGFNERLIKDLNNTLPPV